MKKIKSNKTKKYIFNKKQKEKNQSLFFKQKVFFEKFKAGYNHT